jgi:hypothetical protein
MWTAGLKRKLKKALKLFLLIIVGYVFLALIAHFVIKPPIPVLVTYGHSGYGTASDGIGYVVQVENTSNQDLRLRAIFKTKNINQFLEKDFDLAPFGIREFGKPDGWIFEGQDTVTLMADGYRTYTGTLY